MKVALLFLIPAMLAAPAMADPLDGVWKVDVASAKFPERPDVYLLKDGVFACSSCKPAFSVKADGAFHKVTGYPYMDELAIKVVDARTIEETDKLKGKVAGSLIQTVSTDGQKLNVRWTDNTAPDGKPTTGEAVSARLKSGPSGAHAVSGEWRTEKAANISDAALTLSLKVEGDVMEMSSPNGYSYEAALGGGTTPLKGDPAGTLISVRKTADGALEESSWRDGKVAAVMTMSVAADGKTASVKSENKRYGTVTTYTVIKQ